jgi:hypothetical protein
MWGQPSTCCSAQQNERLRWIISSASSIHTIYFNTILQSTPRSSNCIDVLYSLRIYPLLNLITLTILGEKYRDEAFHYVPVFPISSYYFIFPLSKYSTPYSDLKLPSIYFLPLQLQAKYTTLLENYNTEHSQV